MRFVGVDTEESGKDTPTAQSFPNKNHQLSDYCPVAIFLLALSLVVLPYLSSTVVKNEEGSHKTRRPRNA